MKIKNKIGYCDNKDLKGLEKIPGGHYVYIREVHKDGTCDVNIVTSLEGKDKLVDLKKIKRVRNGNTYPLPKNDATFTRWSGINKDLIKNVDILKIEDIGKKKIKKRHHFFIGKFMK